MLGLSKIITKYYVMFNNKMNVLYYCFKSILFVLYMFRMSYVHHQEGYTVNAALYGMLFMPMMNIRCSKHVEDKEN